MSTLNPQNIAEEIRSLHWADRGFPVDSAHIARSMGIRAIEMPLEPNVSGVIIKEKQKDPVIVVSRQDSTARKRFTAAHELGHYILHLDRSGDDYSEFEHVDFRDGNSSAGTNRDEIFCNQFAAHLLMPSADVKTLRQDGKGLYELSAYFGVSLEAMRHRMSNEGLAF